MKVRFFVFSLMLAASVAVSAQVNNFGRAWDVRYSHSADRTLVVARLQAPQFGYFAPSDTVINLHVGFEFAGRTMENDPDEFIVFFHSLGPRWVVLKNEMLTANVDGKIIELGKSVRDGKFANVFLNGRQNPESLAFRIKRSHLQTIASAKNVKISLGGLKYKIRSDDSDVLKELLSIRGETVARSI